jgi:hypothetical protein
MRISEDEVSVEFTGDPRSTIRLDLPGAVLQLPPDTFDTLRRVMRMLETEISRP